jgi:hypothetical protein
MNSATMGRRPSSITIFTVPHVSQLRETIHSTNDGGPVSVTLIQNDMIRQLNNTNPPLIVFRDNNPEDGPIDRVPGRHLEQDPKKTAAFIIAMQSNNRTLRPLGKIANTTG